MESLYKALLQGKQKMVQMLINIIFLGLILALIFILFALYQDLIETLRLKQNQTKEAKAQVTMSNQENIIIKIENC